MQAKSLRRRCHHSSAEAATESRCWAGVARKEPRSEAQAMSAEEECDHQRAERRCRTDSQREQLKCTPSAERDRWGRQSAENDDQVETCCQMRAGMDACRGSP
jgi:hypothetical protein